jgi:hypothetical protein
MDCGAIWLGSTFGCCQKDIGRTLDIMVVKKTETTLEVIEVTTDTMQLAILGKTPLIFNRLSEKAKRELLLPLGRKTGAQRASSLKHVPLEEYRASPYTLREIAPTRLALLSTMFKAAMATAALDLPGARKAQIERLVHPVYVNGTDRVPLYGTPQMLMSVTRSADMNRTPDIRTRAIVKEWACYITLQWVTPIVHEKTVLNLLGAAGFSIGVGDWRPEKGSGVYGQFEIVSPDNEDFQRILATGGRDAQDAALAYPTFYDQDTEELYSWFEDEVGKRFSANDPRAKAALSGIVPLEEDFTADDDVEDLAVAD